MTRRHPSKALATWWLWCDGFWIIFGASLAASVIAVPIRILWAALRTSADDLWLGRILVALVVLVGPMIVSKVFRALDYTSLPPHDAARSGDERS
jgi:hypothetical protein